MMGRIIFKKIVSSVLTILFIAMLSIVLFINIPGDYADTMLISADDKAALRHELMLDRPKSEQFITWTKRIVLIDYGNSYFMKQPVSSIIKGVIKNSWSTYLSTFIISMILGTFIGCLAAYKKGSTFDSLTRFLVLIGVSTPAVIVSGIVLFVCVNIFHIYMAEKLAAISKTVIWILFVLINLPIFAKYSRNVMIDILTQDYIKTARSKGISEFKVIYKHAFKNSIVGLIGIMGIAVNTAIFSGCLLESVLGFNGIGNLTTFSTLQRDYPLMLACIMILSIVTVVLNLFFDILMHVIDPGTRVDRGV